MEAEEALLQPQRRGGGNGVGFSEEAKKVCWIALPMILVTVSQYLLRVAPLFMLGHLSQLSLSGFSIASSFCNVTGFSLLFGMASALETLCGQAYGAEQYRKLGTYTYGGILCLFLVCIPVSIVWIYTEDLLIFLGQDSSIAHEAGKYAIWLIFTLFPYAILQSLIRFLQSQRVIFPMLLSTVAVVCFHFPVCWVFIFKLKLGNVGAAMSIGLSYWLNVIILVIYVKYSQTCERARTTFSKDVFLTVREFFRFAIPSAVMVCLEWWTFELVIMLSGLLPNPQLETSVLSIGFSITSLHYQIPASFGVAASTLVSNELGAGNAKGAKVSLYAVTVLAASEFLVASAIFFACRYILGYSFSDDIQVVSYIKDVTPVLCVSIIVDSIQAVLSGLFSTQIWLLS